jgi:EAL domain-containing protein (putative c-di-GMP-specific phosphodiesterase class I)
MLSPAAFIPLAEETGLIVSIGEWVLREACRQVREWRRLQAPGEPPLTLSVNLSARQVQHAGLLDSVAAILEDVGFNPQSLTLEITEGLLLQDAELTLSRLRGLKALGVRLALDDFGTGYSSLSYLQRFPIDSLKIDKSFVDRLGEGAEASALVRTIVALSETLELGTVAEGIEHSEQAEQLRALGCQLGQGYHFARPLPGDEIVALLRRDHRGPLAFEPAPALFRDAA